MILPHLETQLEELKKFLPDAYIEVQEDADSIPYEADVMYLLYNEDKLLAQAYSDDIIWNYMQGMIEAFSIVTQHYVDCSQDQYRDDSKFINEE